MQSCELVLFISSLACCIAKDKTDEEIALLSCIFHSLVIPWEQSPRRRRYAAVMMTMMIKIHAVAKINT